MKRSRGFRVFALPPQILVVPGLESRGILPTVGFLSASFTKTCPTGTPKVGCRVPSKCLKKNGSSQVWPLIPSGQAKKPESTAALRRDRLQGIGASEPLARAQTAPPPKKKTKQNKRFKRNSAAIDSGCHPWWVGFGRSKSVTAAVQLSLKVWPCLGQPTPRTPEGFLGSRFCNQTPSGLVSPCWERGRGWNPL